MKVPKPKRTWVEPEQLIALIEAASPTCRPIVATLAGAGLRVGEALALDWRDISLATGTLTVGEAKTAAGTYREVHLPGGLIEALSEWRARNPTGKDKPVFTTRTGSRQTVTNVDHRLKTAIKAATRGWSKKASSRSATASRLTASGAPSRPFATPAETMSFTLPSRAAGPILPSRFASMLGP